MIRPALALALVLVVGCTNQSGTETGNPPIFADLQVGLSARAGDGAVAHLPGEAGAGAEVASAWVAVERIRVVQGDTCDGAGETAYDLGGVTADLVADPRVLAFEGLAGRYCRIRVELAPGDGAAGAPPELVDRSTVLAGRRADGVPFTIASRFGGRFELRSRDGAAFALDEARNAVVVAFDVSAWLAGVDLDAATVEGGRIVVDDDHNRDLLDRFDRAVETALSLHRDRDGDGRVGAGEEAPLDG